ncbi:MAG: hypothetical protein ACRD2N_11690 [Vicinamibacterales bacterium]
MNNRALTAVTLIGALSVVAWLSPMPSHLTDADVYTQMSRDWFIPGCDDLQCFRVLVPWMLGLLPGPLLLKWKGFAVLCEAGAGLAMGAWALRTGASARSATQVTWMTAFGSGALYTLFDPYTSDALMHLLGPALMLLLFDSRLGFATVVAGVGILAKEFAAVPLIVATLIWFQDRRPSQWRPAALASLIVIAWWAAWQVFTRVGYGYSPGGNPSARLLSGGFIAYWATHIDPGLAVSAIAMALGALWVLWPLGAVRGPRLVRQLSLAGLPCLLLWCYVQQPDRALWNFAFVIMPAAAVILGALSPVLAWSIVGAHTLVNLRVGAQLSSVPPARFAFIIAIGLALVAAWQVAAGPRGRLARSFR